MITQTTLNLVRLAGLVTLALSLGTQAQAQERAGVVTTLEGNVTVSRASLPAPAPLKFKDDIYVMDRIATGRDSVARILLGGRAVVTVREHSVVTVTEVPGVSTVDVVAGRAAVAVAREKMRPGDLVEVKTPNAVAGIRGTVIVAEVLDTNRSVITVLKGVIDVTRLDGGRAQVVTALQSVAVVGQAPVSAPQAISPDAARSLGQEFRVAPPRVTPTDATAAVTQGELERTAKYLSTLAPPSGVDRSVAKGDDAGGDRDAKGDADGDDGADRNGDKAKGRRGGDRSPRAVSSAVPTAAPGTSSGGSAASGGSGSGSVSAAPGGSSAPSVLQVLGSGGGELLKSNSGKGGSNKGKNKDR